MPEIQEVFRMATQKVRPDPEALDRQHRGQRRRVAQKRAAVYALVALLLVAGVVIGISTLAQRRCPARGLRVEPAAAPSAEQTLSIVDVGTGTASRVHGMSSEARIDFDARRVDVAITVTVHEWEYQVFVGCGRLERMTADSRRKRGVRLDWSPDVSMIAYER